MSALRALMLRDMRYAVRVGDGEFERCLAHQDQI